MRKMTVVPRISDDEHTFAVVQWEGVEESKLRDALTNAVTEWVDTTEDGQGLWQYSCGDLNIGDLAGHGEDEELNRILAKHGIRNFDITTFSDASGDQDWTYDTVLVNEDALTSEESEDD